MNLKYYLRGLGVGFIVCALILGIHHFRKNDNVMTDDQIRARAEQLGMVEASSRLTDNDAPNAEELLESIDEPVPPEKEEIPVEPAGEDIQADTEQDDGLSGSGDDVTDVPMDDVRSEISQVVTDDPDAVMGDQDGSNSTENADQTANDGAAGSATDQTSGNDATVDHDSDQTSGNGATATEASSGHNGDQTSGNEAAVSEASSGHNGDQTSGNGDVATEASSGASDTGNVNVVGGQITIVSGDSSYRVAKKLEEAGIVASASEYDLYLCNNGYDRYIRTGSFSIPAGSSDQDIAKMITGR